MNTSLAMLYKRHKRLKLFKRHKRHKYVFVLHNRSSMQKEFHSQHNYATSEEKRLLRQERKLLITVEEKLRGGGCQGRIYGKLICYPCFSRLARIFSNALGK
jgi:hypothetical protein